MPYPLVVGMNVRRFRMSGLIHEAAIWRSGRRGLGRRLSPSRSRSVRRDMAAANATHAAAFRVPLFLGHAGGKR